MTSRSSINSLRLNSKKHTFLLDFLKYLNEWEITSTSNNGVGFLSSSTASGLRVTIKSTLDLLEFLTETEGYKYLMTSRLSQDVIENLFGIIRQSSGCNDHPTPDEFLITVQCLSFYNLAKPVKGGNCDEEIINSLISCDEIAPKTQMLEKFNEIINISNLEEVQSLDFDTTYQSTPKFQLLYNFAGYIMRKCLLKINCDSCKNACLLSEANRDFAASFTKHFDKGGLMYASKPVLKFLYQLENILIEYFTSEKLHRDSILDISKIIMEKGVSHIGCFQHRQTLTISVIKFYLMCRLHFYIKGINKTKNTNSEKMKHLKLHRLK